MANQHGNHIASCLCCKHFEFNPPEIASGTEETGDWLEGNSIICSKGVFEKESLSYTDENDLHNVITIGQTCEKFEGR